MRLIAYQLTIAAGSEQTYSLDLSHLGKWVIWARMDGLDLVEFRHGRRVLASGAANGRPIWICEPTRRELDVVLSNHQTGDLTGTLGLYVDSAEFWSFIDEGRRLRTRLFTQVTESSPTDRRLLRCRRKTRDYLAGLIWADMGRSVSRLWGPKGDLIIEATEDQPTFSPIRLEERLSYGDELRAEWWTAPGAMWPWWADITYWEVPKGETEPPFPIPVEPPLDGPMSPEGWGMRDRTPDLGPAQPPVQPVPVEQPPAEPPYLAYPASTSDHLEITAPLPATAEDNPAGDLSTTPATGVTVPWAGRDGVIGLVGIGPSNVHVLRMDGMGRARVAEQAVRYKAGKVETTDASTVTLTPPRPTHRVAFKAAAGAWEVKALTLYDSLRGKTVADADTIYLDEGDPFSEPLEAVLLEVKCPGASASSPGTLYYYLGM